VISLSQKAYAVKIVEKCGLQDCNSSATPMEPRLKLSRQSSELAVDKTLYRSLVGSLRYLVNTWPAIIFVVGYVSRFLEEPCEDHMVAVKRIVRCGMHLRLGTLVHQREGEGSYVDRH
jgi:hypothetical protein